MAEQQWPPAENNSLFYPFLPPTIASGGNYNSNFSYVGMRLASLDLFPGEINVSRIRLAEAGFYLSAGTETRDKLICYSCGLECSGWRGGDSPMEIHRQLSPLCKHVSAQLPPSQRTTTTLREPPPAPSPAAAVSPRVPTAPVGLSTIDHNRSNLLQLLPAPTFDLGLAVFPAFCTPDLRLRTFEQTSWDETRAPSIAQIVRYGMFYAGYADCVRCFYCGLGLKFWLPGDNVLTEHFRRMPNCPYVKMHIERERGPNYTLPDDSVDEPPPEPPAQSEEENVVFC